MSRRNSAQRGETLQPELPLETEFLFSRESVHRDEHSIGSCYHSCPCCSETKIEIVIDRILADPDFGAASAHDDIELAARAILAIELNLMHELMHWAGLGEAEASAMDTYLWEQFESGKERRRNRKIGD